LPRDICATAAAGGAIRVFSARDHDSPDGKAAGEKILRCVNLKIANTE